MNTLFVDFLNVSINAATRLERVVADGAVRLATVALVPVDSHVGDETPKVEKLAVILTINFLFLSEKFPFPKNSDPKNELLFTLNYLMFFCDTSLKS
jgi:hypothetical protein